MSGSVPLWKVGDLAEPVWPGRAAVPNRPAPRWDGSAGAVARAWSGLDLGAAGATGGGRAWPAAVPGPAGGEVVEPEVDRAGQGDVGGHRVGRRRHGGTAVFGECCRWWPEGDSAHHHHQQDDQHTRVVRLRLRAGGAAVAAGLGRCRRGGGAAGARRADRAAPLGSPGGRSVAGADARGRRGGRRWGRGHRSVRLRGSRLPPRPPGRPALGPSPRPRRLSTGGAAGSAGGGGRSPSGPSHWASPGGRVDRRRPDGRALAVGGGGVAGRGRAGCRG